MAAAPWAALTSMNTDAVCDRVKLIDGLDASMLEQYTTTIKKVRMVSEKGPSPTNTVEQTFHKKGRVR